MSEVSSAGTVSGGVPRAPRRSGTVCCQQAPSAERGPERLCGGLRRGRAGSMHPFSPYRLALAKRPGRREAGVAQPSAWRHPYRFTLQSRPRSVPASANGRASSEGTRL